MIKHKKKSKQVTEFSKQNNIAYKMTGESKKSTKKGLFKFEKKERPSTTVKSLPYKSFEKSNITVLNKNTYSKTFKFSDINYHTSRQEEQEDYFLEYGNILNSFDSSTKIQISIINEDLDINEFRNRIISHHKGDNLDEYRDEYNRMIDDKLSQGASNLKQNKYLTVTIDAHNIEVARNKFNRIHGELETHFKKLDSTLEEVSNEEKTIILKNIYRGRNVNIYPERLNFKTSQEKTAIAPNYMEFKHNHFVIGNKFCKTLFLRDIPTFLTDKMITELTELEFKTLLAININPVEPDKAQEVVRTQITIMESNQYEKEKKAMQTFTPYVANHKLQESLEEAKELLDDLVKKNQKMFLTNIVVTVFADTQEELDLNVDSLKTIARKHVCNFATLNYQQEVGFNSTLPIGNCQLKARRTLTTESTSIFMPFNVKEISVDNGNYYGIHSISKKIVVLNRKQLKNSNGWIFGDSGSGKSFFAKKEIANTIMNNDDDVIIISPSHEYDYLTRSFGGEVIEISNQTKNFINPMDMDESYADSGDPIALKSDFIISFCDTLMGEHNHLTSRQKAIIDRCVRNIYKDYVVDFNKDKIPTLGDLYEEVLKQKEEDAEDIALTLEMYVKGSLDIFAHKTNIDSKNRILCFDTNGLGNNLKTTGLLVVLNAVWNRVIENYKKGRATWIYIDEVHLFFKNYYALNFLQELYKIIRKWGGIPTGITQDIDDLLKNEQAITMLNNSQFLTILGQSDMNANRIQDIFGLSDTQKAYIRNSEKGSGLIYYGGSIIPFKDNFPKDLKLYDIFDTTPESAKSS